METTKDLKEVLEEKIQMCDKVLIVPHISPDFDALASSVGLVNICKKFGKESYILINDNEHDMSNSVKEMIFDIKEQYKVINLEQYLDVHNDNDLMIATDVNKDYRVAIKDYLNKFKTKIIIDHHDVDKETIKTNLKYINTSISSASEIVAKLLTYMNIKYDDKCATYLYAGLILDTDHFRKINPSADTLNVASKLIKKGANIAYVNDLFKVDLEEDRKIHQLLSTTKMQYYSYGIAASEEQEYTKENLAIAADQILNYGSDASFAIGMLDSNTVGVSGRSNGNINIGNVLKLLGGGGNAMSGATVIENTNVEEVTKKLKLVLTPGNNI